MSFENCAFQSRRAASQVSILLISRTPELAPMLKETLLGGAGTQVSTLTGTLSDLLQSALRARNWNVVVFETAPETARDLAALGEMADETRFLALIPETMDALGQDAYRTAGVDEILPITAIAETVEEPPFAPDHDDARDDLIAPVPQQATDGPAQAVEPTNPPVHTTHLSAPVSRGTVPASAGTGQVTVVMRARGGAGATTVALNLAAALCTAKGKNQRDPSVALIDLDIQGGKIGVLLDLPDSEAFTALIRDRAIPGSGFLDRALVKHASGLSVLAAPDQFAPLTALSPEMVAALIEHLRRQFDHVVVDLPQAVMEWIAPILSAASRLLIVTDTSVPSIKQTRRLVDLVGEENMTLPVRIVVNRERKPVFASAAHKEASRLLGRPLAHWIPSDPRAARRAEDMGQPMALISRRSAASRAIGALAETIRTAVPATAKN